MAAAEVATYRRVLHLCPRRMRQLADVMACDGEEHRCEEVVEWLAEEFAALDHSRRMYIVAEHADTIVGFVRLWHSPHIEEWVIDGLVVSPAQRRQSVGESLLRPAIDLASQSGAASVIAHILEDNVASMRLHEKVGFVRERADYRNSYGQPRNNVGWQYRIQCAPPAR